MLISLSEKLSVMISRYISTITNFHYCNAMKLPMVNFPVATVYKILCCDEPFGIICDKLLVWSLDA